MPVNEFIIFYHSVIHISSKYITVNQWMGFIQQLDLYCAIQNILNNNIIDNQITLPAAELSLSILIEYVFIHLESYNLWHPRHECLQRFLHLPSNACFI